MRRGSRAFAAAVTVSALIAAPAPAFAAGPPMGHAGLQNRLDRVVAAGAVGAIAEVRRKHDLWRGASGAAEYGTTRPVPIDSRFRIGSVTKTFVAVVVLQLVAEGRLRLDDTVFPGRAVTVRHLLGHTSGVPDYRPTLPMPPSPGFFANRWRTWTPDELIGRVATLPPVFEEPGSKFDYSNTNYLLLGKIIENVTGHPYAKEIERRVTGPLRLRGTSLPGTSPRLRGPHPHGYVPGETGLVDLTEMNPSVMGAGGEMISTTADLQRFLARLLGGHLLPDRLLAKMKTPGTATRDYGLGLSWWTTSCGLRVYGNDGDALAYQTWTFATEDASRLVTVAVTPDFTADLDDAVEAFVDAAICAD
ncbi:serine hydrolase domain-containing protein [Actinoplanes sp. NPDC051861]|uniref:serine hydrolase domain-containing protein n=1 Tax=Actinoplanes sp. NPDC051861 TaxID=3155170 RepID=UPI00341D6D31